MDHTVLMILSSVIGIGALGMLFGGGLAFAAKKFAVAVDPRVEAIQDVLPKANCGACGYPGCAAFAEAVVAGKVGADDCIPGGAETAQKIAEILGREIGESKESSVAIVRCKGGREQAKERFRYQGLEDCNAAVMLAGGGKGCVYGCLGLGSCVRACPFDAMRMNNNALPEVLEDACTGCGICVQTCPRDIMELIPRSQVIYLACKSQDRGKEVKAVCSVGCTGCTLCANPKTTPSGSIEMRGFLPQIVKPLSGDLKAALEKCPTNSFASRECINTEATPAEAAVSK